VWQRTLTAALVQAVEMYLVGAVDVMVGVREK
jgi:hypothetical protein